MPDGGAGWNERTESMTPSRDAEGHLRAMRVFRVWGYARTQIIADPTQILSGTTPNASLPGYNSPWEGMKLDRYDVAAVGNIFDATALYSNDARFRLPNAPAKLDGSWSWRQELVEVPIAYAELKFSREVIAAPGGGPPTIIEQPGWRLDTRPINHIFQRVGFQTYLNHEDMTLAMDALGLIADSLQKIKGRWWLAEPGAATEEEDDRWHVEYSFVSDPGTRPITQTKWYPENPASTIPVVMYPPGNQPWPPSGGIGGPPPQMFSRPPFHTSEVGPGSSTDPYETPVFGATLNKDMSNPLGWASLPKFNP